MPTDLFSIVHEDADLLVINKAAGLVCHPTKTDARSSLAGRLRLYFGAEAKIHLINRLDRETSGLIVVGKTVDAARELRRIWAERKVRKRYLAVVHGWLTPDEGLIDEPLGRDERSEIAIKDRVRQDGASARTWFQIVNRFTRPEGDFSTLKIEPLTGRKHQIRIHLAHLGHPIVGDKLYGPDERLYLDFVKSRLDEAGRKRLILPCQALHAFELRFNWRSSKTRHYSAPPEDWLREFSIPSLANESAGRL